MKFDELMTILGEFGKYQKIRFFLICLFGIVSAWHALSAVFVLPDHKFTCDITGINLTNTHLQGLTDYQKEKLFLPSAEDDACYQYNVTQAIETARYGVTNQAGLSSVNITGQRPGKKDMIACTDGYLFSSDIYKTSITKEFELVCERKFWRSTSKSVFFAGRLVGAVVFGQLSDIFGRRPLFFAGVLLLIVAGSIASVANSLALFLSMYFLQGAAHTGAFLVSYTLSTELVGPKYRVVAGFVIQGFYSLGFMSLAGLAFFIREWRYLEMAITAPALLFGVYYWFLPESIRWLLSRNRDEEADKYLQAAAKQNGVVLDKDVVKDLKNDPSMKGIVDGKKYYLHDCLRTWPMARLSLNIWFNWLVNALVYYGLSLNTENLGGNNYVNFCIAGAVEIPAYLLCILLLNRVGRRWPLIVFMYLGGFACILSGCIPNTADNDVFITILAMVGKFGITASYTIIYLLAAECFPTVIRTIGMGVSSMSARIGGILAPIILDLQLISKPLPVIVFGSLALFAGSLAYLLPETAGKPLPQLPQDADYGKSLTDVLTCRKKSGKADFDDVREMKDIRRDTAK